jgi:FecR-like protein
MSSITRWVALAVTAGAAVLGPAAPSDAQAPGTAQVILARAPVEVVPKGQAVAQPLQKGARLSEGDRIRTGKGGVAEVVLGDGSLVRVGELSDLEIDKLDVDAANQPTTSRFNLASGQARAWVARQVVAKVGTGMGRFAVQTPTAVAAVRQTDFALLQGMAPSSGGQPTPDGTPDTRVYVFAGTVQADATQAGQVLCTRNRYTRVQSSRDPTPCRVIPLWDKRSVLSSLAFEGAAVAPGNLDRETLGVIDSKLDKSIGGALTGGTGQSNQSSGTAPEKENGLANVDISVN